MVLESNKKELVLGLNSFNAPAELTGKNAWINLILHLMFIKKGTYPSNPIIGIGIQTYDYQFIKDVIVKLQDDITNQVKTFLPEIPLDSVVVDTTEVSGKVILLIIITFTIDGTTDVAVVASQTSNNIIDFEVSM